MSGITPELKLLLACCRLDRGIGYVSNEQVELECLPVIRDLPIRWQEFVQLTIYHNVHLAIYEIFSLSSMQGLMPKKVYQSLQQQAHETAWHERLEEPFLPEYLHTWEQHAQLTQHHRPIYVGKTDQVAAATEAHRLLNQEQPFAAGIDRQPDEDFTTFHAKARTGDERNLLDGERLLAICLHGATQQWHRLRWLYDFAKILKRPHLISWNEWEEQVVTLRSERYVIEGFVLASALLAAPIPKAIFHLIDQNDIMPIVNKAIHAMLTVPQEAPNVNTNGQAQANNPFNRFTVRRSRLQHS